MLAVGRDTVSLCKLSLLSNLSWYAIAIVIDSSVLIACRSLHEATSFGLYSWSSKNSTASLSPSIQAVKRGSCFS